jgi:hypothetical protein
MKKLVPSILVLALALPTLGVAKTTNEDSAASWCGTTASRPAISYARHQFNLRRHRALHPQATVVGQPGMPQGLKIRKEKNIAVIEDDGTILPPPNLFDLEQNGVQFKRGGPATRIERFPGAVSTDRGGRIEIGDDDSQEISLPFPFTFYGTTYNRVFLNSDGNLTFDRAESASSARSLSRFLDGPPRIAVDFLDLDPSAAGDEGGVYLLRQNGLVRVTWLDVPEFGLTNASTFQVTLYPNGRITMAYENVAASVGIVGVSPGGPGLVDLLDLTQSLPTRATDNAIAEEFRVDSGIDDMAAAAAVLSAVRDEYDIIVLFADFPVDLGNALAYHSPVKNTIQGIAPFGSYDLSRQYGSNGRLEGFIQMGSLDKYPAGPNNDMSFFDDRPGISILAHEVGHRWLAFARFRTDQGQLSTDLLGRQTAHWSFLMDSDGSIMEGNDIRDNGDGTFTTGATYQGFSALDLYLMGFRRASEVPPFFYVTGSILDPEDNPASGVIITGQRRNVSLNRVISAMGPRVPDFDGAQKRIQVAFALLGRQGEPPSPESIRKVNQYRNRLSTYFRQQTDDRGRIATWLRLRKTAQSAKAGVTSPTSPDLDTPTEATAPAAAAPPHPANPPVVPARRLDQLEEPRRR